jgi:tripartite-type tricarboxylate transporter receptor subunit TctC
MMAGRIDYFCALGAGAVAPLESKTLKAIAILTKERSALFPGLASAHEQGLTDFDSYFWSGFFLPKGTPADIVKKLHDASTATLDTPSTQERLKKAGTTVVGVERRSPAYLKTFVENEVAQWAATIKASGVSLD